MKEAVDERHGYGKHEVEGWKSSIDRFTSALKQLMDYDASNIVKRAFDNELDVLLYFSKEVSQLIDECIIEGNTENSFCNKLFSKSRDMVETIKQARETCKKRLECQAKEDMLLHTQELYNEASKSRCIVLLAYVFTKARFGAILLYLNE